MLYTAEADIEALIPADFLTQALDDDGDGTRDAWALVSTAACREVDALLGPRFRTPFATPIPPVVRHAATIIAAATCYQRRGVEKDKNPFAAAAEAVRAQLRDIAAGKLPLDPDIGRAKPSVSIITSPSRLADVRLAV